MRTKTYLAYLIVLKSKTMVYMKKKMLYERGSKIYPKPAPNFKQTIIWYVIIYLHIKNGKQSY